MKYFKLLIIIFVLILLPFGTFSQTVSATFFNVPQQKVYLTAFNGLYFELVDSVMMSQDKRVEFNAPMKKGMYSLETEYSQSVDFIYDDAPVRLLVKDIYDDESFEFIGSQANTDWLAYKRFKEQTLNSLNLLKPILRDYDKDSEFYIKSLNEYQQLQDAYVSFTDSLMLHDNYASKLIRVDRFPSINLDDDFKKQRNDMIANFFNDVDFNDLSLIPTDVLTKKIFDFMSIQITTEQNKDQKILSLILASDNVLNRATVNYEMYKFVFQFLIELFNELKINEAVDYLTRIPYSEEFDCSEEQYEELLSIAEFNSRAKIGSLAENISGKTVFDEEFDLYSIENEYTLIYFWSYTCDHCRESLKELETFLNENKNFSMIAVSVKGDVRKIRNLARKYDAQAYFYHDGLEWDCPFVNAYGVTATPSFYLLDKEKKIIFKPFEFNELVNFINVIDKQ